MADEKSDMTVILEAYKKYKDFAKKKQYTKKQAKLQANEIFRQADRCLLFLNSPSTTVPEKDRLLRKSKPLYQQYVSFSLGNSEAVTRSLALKMDSLLEQMAIHEASQVESFRNKTTGGDRISLEAIMSEENTIRHLPDTDIRKLLKAALKDRRFTIVSKTDQKVYITKSGNKYHRANCPYCRRVKLTEASFEQVKNAGYEPCRCIGTTDKVLVKPKESQTMTVFIDESVRQNVWSQFDSDLKKTQASYSYIICKGALQSENEITKKNTMSKNACLANEAQDTSYAAVEAIGAVLMKLAFRYNFHDDVLIYTDNQTAVNKWYQNSGNAFLASQFDSVKVTHISREENKIADAIGRERIFTDVPQALVGQLKKRWDEHEFLKEEMDFVRHYFPNPRKQIPNLVRELRYMAYQKGENE